MSQRRTQEKKKKMIEIGELFELAGIRELRVLLRRRAGLEDHATNHRASLVSRAENANSRTGR
jgi:hypothetical protein